MGDEGGGDDANAVAHDAIGDAGKLMATKKHKRPKAGLHKEPEPRQRSKQHKEQDQQQGQPKQEQKR